MASAPATPPNRWLFGPVSDMLVGCGLWYVVALGVFAVAGEAIRSHGGLVVAAFGLLLLSTPHYGATLLRVYRRREDRRAYAAFAVWASVALVAAFTVGVHDAWVGSLLLTLYLTWSPWHYAGQNYGLAVMFLRRAGVPLPTPLKRAFYASFLLSYGLTFLALHSGGDGSLYAPVSHDGVNYRFLSLGIPTGFADPAFAALLAAYLVSLGIAGVGLLRGATWRVLAPAAALVLAQALWFTVPLAIRHLGIPSIEPWTSRHGTYYFLWIAMAHAAQYVWVTSYYARSAPEWRGEASYLVKVMAAGAAIWVIPALLFAPTILGRLPYDGGLSVLIAAVVNLHHFVLDGAIWKLRDGRVARILLRAREEPTSGAIDVRRWPRWLPATGWLAAAACIVLMFAAAWERDVAIPRASARGDAEAVRGSLDRLARLGRDSPKMRRALADSLLRRHDTEGALREYQRAVELRSTATDWYRIGLIQNGASRPQQAAEAFEAAVALGPTQPEAFYQLGRARLELGQPERARDALQRAVELAPERGIYQTLLDRALEQIDREPAKAPRRPSVAAD